MKGGGCNCSQRQCGSKHAQALKKKRARCVATSAKREWETGRPRNREQCGHGMG